MGRLLRMRSALLVVCLISTEAHAQSVGNAPAAPLADAASPPLTHGGPVSDERDQFRFGYSGYFRAPFRVGVGRKDTVRAEGDESKTTFHVPILPDDQYVNWQHTRHNERDWAEMFFSMGNSWVSGTLAIEAFNFTDAAWKEEDSQFGIAQGWVSLRPKLGWEGARLEVKLGSFSSRYGTAGRYDAGEYDTYLFGRTHAMGETVRLDLEQGEFELWFEQGLGGKRPNPKVSNRGRFTLLAHGHAGATWSDTLSLGLHALTSWTQHEMPSLGLDLPPDGTVMFDTAVPDGRLSVWGADLEWRGGAWGRLYAGYSRTQASYAFTVAPAIEVIHSLGGGEFSLGVVDQYLEAPLNPRDDRTMVQDCHAADVWNVADCGKGNGVIDTLLAQYELSVRDLSDAFSAHSLFGQTDLKAKFYGMLNRVSSETRVVPEYRSYRKLKYGVDLEFDPLPGLGVGLRADRVEPQDHFPEQAFSVLSPRVSFRSQFLSRETLTLQYSRYFYARRECASDRPLGCTQAPPSGTAPDGFGSAPGVNQDATTRGAAAARPDLSAIKLEASIWW